MKPWRTFSNIQHKPKRLKYMLSPMSAHEQAIREHVKRGHAEGLARVAGLLVPGNKI